MVIINTEFTVVETGLKITISRHVDTMGKWYTAVFCVRGARKQDNFTSYLTRHDMRTYSTVVTGFLLLTFRVCSEEFIQDER